MVGAVPFTVRCLELDSKVQIDEADPNFSEHETVGAANHNATSTSTAKGFDGELTKVVSH